MTIRRVLVFQPVLVSTGLVPTTRLVQPPFTHPAHGFASSCVYQSAAGPDPTKPRTPRRHVPRRVRILNHLFRTPARPPRPHRLDAPLPTPHAVSHEKGNSRTPPHLGFADQHPMYNVCGLNGSMTDYSRWTKESLVDRIRLLEEALKEHEAAHPTPGVGESGRAKKKHKGLDMSRYATRFVALKIAYLGKRYGGFEYQPSGSLPTIEEELWKALSKACLVAPRAGLAAHEVDFDNCEYSKCGRTDRGVSSFGQVVALRLRSNRRVSPESVSEAVPEADLPWQQEMEYAKIINRLLPADIRVLAWCPAPPPGFNARFSCRERKYRYFFTQPAYYGAPVPENDGTTPAGMPADGWLDFDAMRAAARHFVGVHDFRNFCKIDANKQITNFTRRIFACTVTEEPGLDSTLNHYTGSTGPRVFSFNVSGSAFLWHQIRHMVAVVFLVGQGRESPDVVRQMLDTAANPARPAYAMADEFPLVLWDCIFPGTPDTDRQLAEADPGARTQSSITAEPAETAETTDEGDPDAPWHTWTDGLAWVSAFAEQPSSRLFVDGLWREWRAAKMDEILANRLLDQVTRGAGGIIAGAPAVTPPVEKTHVFEGGDGPRRGGVYVPLMQRPRTAAPEVVNDRFAQQKGFASSAEMRAAGNWRTVIKERKAQAEAEAQAEANAHKLEHQ